MKLFVRGLSVKFVDTANKTRIMYHRRMKCCINKYQLSDTMHTQYNSVFLNIDWFIQEIKMKSGVLLSCKPSFFDRLNLISRWHEVNYLTLAQRLSIFMSILMMTQGTQKTDDRTDSRNVDSRKEKLQPVEWESVVTAVVLNIIG